MVCYRFNVLLSEMPYFWQLIGYGSVAPSLLAVPFLAVSGYMTWTKWDSVTTQTFEHDIPTSTQKILPSQNQTKKPKFSKLFLEGLRSIVQVRCLKFKSCEIFGHDFYFRIRIY